MSRIVTLPLPHQEPYIRCLWPVVGSETVTRIRSTAASSRHIQNTVTGHSRCQCSGQFISAAVFSASLSFPFPIQLLNWVRTNVAHLRLGINKQSVWREQESRIHFATQKKFNVNKQCITALSSLHLWLTTTCLIQPDSWWTLWTRPSIMMAAEHDRERGECTCHLSADRRRSHGVSFKPRNNASSTHFIPLKLISNNK